MTSFRRPLLLLFVFAVLGAIAAILVWSPLGVLEESAGPLDAMLPPDVDAAVRLDPGTLAWSPAALALWEHPAVADARASAGLDESVLEPIRALERRIGSATLGLAPSVERDVLGQEIVVALRGAHVLLLSRLTARGKLMDAAARLDTSELRELGLRVQGDTAVLEREDGASIYLRRIRDVLAVSTSAELLATAVARGEPPEGVTRPRSTFAAALLPDEPPGARVLFWWRPLVVEPSAVAATPAREGALGLLSELLPSTSLDVLAGQLDLSVAQRVTCRVAGGWREIPPVLVAALADGVAGGADGLQAEAVRLAVPGEAAVVVGLALRAREVVLALADAQPPARRELVDEILAERDLTVELLADRIASHLEDGVAAVVSRLPEADDLQLDDPRAGGVHPIPATLVALRLRNGSTPEGVVLELAAEAEALFGAPVVLTAEEGPGGARVHRLEKYRLGGEWQLLRPAFAVVDGLLVFSTHDAHLIRALEHRAAGAGREAVSGPAATLAVTVDGEPLRRHVDDQRWEWADRDSLHDWRTERQIIRRELDVSGSVLTREDRQVYEDERIAMRLERRNAVEFPAAIARYREMWKPLEALQTLSISGERNGASFQLLIRLELAEPDRR